MGEYREWACDECGKESRDVPIEGGWLSVHRHLSPPAASWGPEVFWFCSVLCLLDWSTKQFGEGK